MTSISDVYKPGAGALVVLLNDQIFNTSGTWVKPAGPFADDDMALIEMWGGGGSGAGSGTDAASGGFAGAYVRFAVPISQLSATMAVVVGAGGASVTATSGVVNGNPGGDTSFAGEVARGGPGGRGDLATIARDIYLSKPSLTYSSGNGGGYGGASGFSTPAQTSVYGGNGGDAFTASSGVGTGGNGQAPGGGGGMAKNNGSTSGAGATGRVRVRILRGLNQFEISEGPL